MKLLKSKRFWLILITASVAAADAVRPFMSPNVAVVMAGLAAVAGTVLTMISPTAASQE